MSPRRAASAGIVDHEDRQAMVEVLAEAAGLDQRLDVLVGGRDDAQLDRDLALAAEPPEAHRVEELEELGLRARGQLRDLVEEERAPVAISISPRRVALASVKAPFSWPKSSLSTRSSGSAAQLTSTKGASVSPATR